MAKSKRPVTNYEVSFVSCELDKSTKEAVKAWDVKFEATIDAIDRLILDGYKVSISQDKFHDCTAVFMTMPDKTHKHSGLCLTARGPNYLSALKVLVYKHYNILQEDWGAVVEQAYKRDSWG